MMRYDLTLIHELCGEIGLPSTLRSPEELAIELAGGVVLCFQNSDKEEDCLVGFEGTPWHTHDDFQFADHHGYHISMNYFDVVAAIPEGKILVGELWNCDRLVDRWLIHRDYVDEFRHMEEGDEVRIRRVSLSKRQSQA